MAQKTSIPKGTRDFSPVEMAKRNYIFDTIREAFRLYGYRQIETPAMENLSTLMGKYGEEGDKLLFKILNSGDFMKKVNQEDLEAGELNRVASQLCEKGLRYDLTVPFARYVVQHRNELQLPFKRFQMQPVWRADRPQKGRYREFWQCDADIVGSDSLYNEIDLLSLLDYVFGKLGVRVAIKLNNRKVLSGIAEIIGERDKLVDITVAIDKIDKIGIEEVESELISKGVGEDACRKLRPLLELSGNNEEKLATLEKLLENSEEGSKGVAELREVYQGFISLNPKAEVDIDVSLARGLNYYTGVIIEVKALDAQIGSISGGGRYDNLTGVFGMSGLSGVGVSFGADRIYDVIEQLDLFPEKVLDTVTVLFLNLGDKESALALKCVTALRREGIPAALYPDAAKLKKQFQYADALKVPLVAMIGEDELQNGSVTVRDMATGSQTACPIDEVDDIFRIYSKKSGKSD
ncbi:MAG: histidine--tRNA ligase [Prevotella sp.]|nr:histidine--tRNA ligase [Bacteroides sp.]MCM1366098.1 histidine--tRNA ligase [Prevotella sp.]MCM1436583.1 histidine--tRNA ligase [Prevotella sp.]